MHFKATIRRKIERFFYKRRYSAQDIVTLMKSMGLKKGATIFIHSSWKEFYNYTGTINEFIDALLVEIGTDGTLAMPAFPLLKKTDNVFRINNTPSTTGILTEIFRNYPDVKRSANKSSVCAFGPKSDYLVNEHLYSVTSYDEKSPYYKLAELDALIFSFGLTKYYIGTSIHCVESLLRHELPYFHQFFTTKNILKIEMEDKTIYYQESYTKGENLIYWNYRSKEKFIKHLDKSKYVRKKLSNLSVNMYEAKYLVNESIALGREGIVMYKIPIPSKKLFVKINS